jgi:class 3 adenylate cyclase
VTVHNPINCTKSSDAVINQTCQWIYDTFPRKTFMEMNSTVTYTPTLLGQTYYVKSSILADGNGLVWALVIAVPRATIMGKIDAAVSQTTTTINKQAEDTRQDKEYKYMVMYIVLSVSAAALIVLSIVFTIAITSPMITLQDEMAAVACMELEYVDMERPTSGLEEVGSMQVSFLQMVNNLREYRNYMPASILASGGDDEEEETPADDEEKEDTPAKKPGDEDSEPAAKVRKPSHIGTTSKQSSDNASKMAVKKAAVSSMDVKKKRISLMVVNIKGWHAIIDSASPNDAAFLHSTYVHMVLEAVNANKGTADVFLGDRFVASWNTIKNLGTHRSNACHTALKAVKGVKELNDANAAQQLPTLSLSAAVSCGEARCGNMGCDGMKKYTFVGPVAVMVHALERRNKKYGTSILLDGAVEEEAKNVFFVRKVDHVLVPRLQERPFKLFELISTKAVSEDEWMYQLQEGEHGDPYAVFSGAVDLYLKGQFEEAITALDKCTAKDDQFTRFHDLLESVRASNGTAPQLEKLDYVL